MLQHDLILPSTSRLPTFLNQANTSHLYLGSLYSIDSSQESPFLGFNKSLEAQNFLNDPITYSQDQNLIDCKISSNSISQEQLMLSITSQSRQNKPFFSNCFYPHWLLSCSQ